MDVLVMLLTPEGAAPLQQQHFLAEGAAVAVVQGIFPARILEQLRLPAPTASVPWRSLAAAMVEMRIAVDQLQAKLQQLHLEEAAVVQGLVLLLNERVAQDLQVKL